MNISKILVVLLLLNISNVNAKPYKIYLNTELNCLSANIYEEARGELYTDK